MSAVLEKERVTSHQRKPFVPTTQTAGGGDIIPPAFKTTFDMGDYHGRGREEAEREERMRRLTGTISLLPTNLLQNPDFS